MKIHLYKVLGFDYTNEPTGWDILENTMIMTLDDLRKEFLWAYEKGHIASDIIGDFIRDPDYAKENWDDIGSLSAGTMIDIMNSLIDYGAPYCYEIHETDLIIGE